MKLAIISMIRDSWGGSEELWYDMAKVALQQGHSVSHLSFEVKTIHPKLQELISMGLVSYTRPGFRASDAGPLDHFIRLGVTFLKKKMNSSIKEIFKSRPDIVIYNGTCYSITQESILARYIISSRPDFYIIGHLNSEIQRGINDTEARQVKKMYALCKKVFFISERSRNTAERHLCSRITNSEIIRNPVNLSHPSAVSYPFSGEFLHFALVGNLITAHKGQDVLLSVLAAPAWKERNYHLNIYGSGPDETYLRDLTTFYELTEKVTFHGIVTDISKVWQKNHILLMPSHMEGMPLAVVEAMLCGRASVVTDRGGMTEWIEHGKSGFIAASSTLGSLGEALEQAWRDKDKWEEMGLYARKRALELYHPEAGNKLLEMILK